ncbi:MAG: cobalamin-dependent protein [Candidatus Bipolaricaulia bacterium]
MDSTTDDPLDSLRARYKEALLNGKARTADAVLDEGINRGVHVVTLYQEVMGPALARIGELWRQGDYGIADEHLATQIALGQMARLRREVRPRAARNLAAVVTAVEGNQHSIGARMVADVLVFDGWDVDFLGANMPASNLVDFVERHDHHLVALSITLSSHLDAAHKTVAALKALEARPAILVGGPAGLSHWDELTAAGADGFASECLTALHEARRLVGLEAELPSLEQVLVQLGGHVKALRRARDWSQQALADASGLDRTYISAVEHGKQNLTIGAMLKLAQALDVDIPDLVSRDGLDRMFTESTDAHP